LYGWYVRGVLAVMDFRYVGEVHIVEVYVVEVYVAEVVMGL